MMVKTTGFLFLKNGRKVPVFIALALMFFNMQAQQRLLDCDPFVDPVLFGLSKTYIYCKNTSVGFGVSNSKVGQDYVFSVYKNGVESRKAGPLGGNGGQLSISESMKSAQNSGEYRITVSNECGATSSINFFVFYASIDNLSITAWGGNAVTFTWAACGAGGANDVVTYEYAVTTESNPNSAAITYSTTTLTTITKTGLTGNLPYYIHVRVKSATLNGANVQTNFNCPGGAFPWQTLKFLRCAGTAGVGSIMPSDTVICTGGTAPLSANGGDTYQWYTEDNSIIAGATTSNYTASSIGQYRVYITTAAGCAGMVSSATVTQTSVLTGTFFGSGCFHVGDSVRLGISRTVLGQTYKILKNGVEVASLQGIGRAAESLDSVLYKFEYTGPSDTGTYTVRIENPYCNTVDFGSQVVSAYGSWSGTVSSDWGNIANWSCGELPDANTDVIIKSTALHFPEVTNDSYCKSLHIETGAIITVKAGFNLFIMGQ